ncbi:hypothetical protein [Microvirga massiliensis]|uniref:hypothetical protein n=1 Tax=Microvirga massiliensis TaxID=1033741 RepID=UPI00062B673F|nr:hypothetical protein [Microvirga massiliensis]
MLEPRWNVEDGTRQPRNLEIGIKEILVDSFHLRVTEKARTMLDLVSWGGIRQHTIETMRTYLADTCNSERPRTMAAPGTPVARWPARSFHGCG